MTTFRIDWSEERRTEYAHLALAEAALDPVSRPSSRTRLALASEAKREARRSAWAGLTIIAAMLAMLVVLAALSGCSTTSEQRLHVVREGRILLRKPAVGDTRWEDRRKMFLVDADLVDPPEGK